MDFIRNLFTLFQRLQDIVREGQSRRDLPGMALALLREMRGGQDESTGEGDGPAVYGGRRAQADQGTPAAASRATARNRAARNADLPEPAIYRSPEGAGREPEFAPARAPARNADDRSADLPQPAAAPLQREEYDYQPASADPDDLAPEPAFEPAMAPTAAEEAEPIALSWDDEVEETPPAPPPSQAAPPVPAPAAARDAELQEKRDGEDGWFDIEDWQGTALKVAGVGAAAAATAAGAMAIKDRFFDEDEDRDEKAGKNGAPEQPDSAGHAPAIPLGPGAEPTALDAAGDSGEDGDDDTSGTAWKVAAAMAAPAAASVLPKLSESDEDALADATGDAAPPPALQTDKPRQPQRAQEVEIIPGDAQNRATQRASQTLASPGIRLYGTMDAKMYAEFTERLAEQAPGGPIVISLTTTEGDPEIARSMADDIRLLRDRGRREIVFLGKNTVYSAGVLFMAAFPVGQRYLTRATKLLITENKRAQPLELAGGSLRSVASQLEHAQREIQREIAQEDEDYRAISEGSNVSIQELREKAPNDWHITASEAKAMGLIAEVV